MKTVAITTADNQAIEPVNERPATAPRVDIFENKDEYLVRADMPGANEDRIKLHLDKERLTIEAEVTSSRTDAATAREFDVVDYRRSFMIPDAVDHSKVAAELKHGVLTLHLPKSGSVKPRRIEVKAG